MPQTDAIPKVNEINAAWLGALLGAPIDAVTAQAVGTGQVGATIRFGLSAHQSSVPASLIGKFMSDDPVSRATGIAQSSYLREVNFYQTFGDAGELPIPTLKFAAINNATHEFALIMDDFPAHHVGNQLEPATLSQATLAMSAAAKIHSAFWDDKALEDYVWLNGSHAAATMDVDALYAMLWPAFCQRYQGRISQCVVKAGDAYLGRINSWIARRTGPRCLTHGDFRPDNMLFATDDHAHPIIIVDWQTAGVGNGATDVAYYLGTALEPDMRRTHEQELVALWIDGLVRGGVDTSDVDNLWHNYRRDSVSGFLMGVLASMIVAQTARGDLMFLEMCARSAQMIHDHDSVALI